MNICPTINLHPCLKRKERCVGFGSGETQRIVTVSGSDHLSTPSVSLVTIAQGLDYSVAVESHLGDNDVFIFMETERTVHTFIAPGPF